MQKLIYGSLWNWYMIYSNDYVNFFTYVCSNFHFCPCTSIYSYHCSKQCFWNSFHSHCPYHDMPRYSIKCNFWCTMHMHNYFFLPKYSLCIFLHKNTASIVALPGIWQNYMSSIFTILINHFSCTFCKLFLAFSSNFTFPKVHDIYFSSNDININTGSEVTCYSISI